MTICCPSIACTPPYLQDDYFITKLDDPSDYGPTRPNLETPSGVDWPSFTAAIENARERLEENAPGTGLVVVEGFLLLASAGDDVAASDQTSSSALPLFDAIFFLNCPGEECLRRRLARNPDRTAEQAAGLRGYWHNCTWPGYLKYTVPVLQKLQHASDERLVVIDAMRSETEVISAVLDAATTHPRLPMLRRYRPSRKL